MNVYKQWIGPLLFRHDTETAHSMVRVMLRSPYLSRLCTEGGSFVRDERLQVDLGGLRILNPAGLGAGFDKDCEMVGS